MGVRRCPLSSPGPHTRDGHGLQSPARFRRPQARLPHLARVAWSVLSLKLLARLRNREAEEKLAVCEPQRRAMEKARQKQWLCRSLLETLAAISTVGRWSLLDRMLSESTRESFPRIDFDGQGGAERNSVDFAGLFPQMPGLLQTRPVEWWWLRESAVPRNWERDPTAP